MKGNKFTEVNNNSYDVLEWWSVSRTCIVNLGSGILYNCKNLSNCQNQGKVALGFFTILQTLKIWLFTWLNPFSLSIYHKTHIIIWILWKTCQWERVCNTDYHNLSISSEFSDLFTLKSSLLFVIWNSDDHK